MFGFLIGGEVNDDAVALKKLVEVIMNKYAALEYNQIAQAITADFDKEYRFVDSNNFNFVFKELPEFQFGFTKSYTETIRTDLSVIGRGKYAGFMLQVLGGTDWVASASDGIAYRATGGAKKLVEVLHNKYGLYDMNKLMRHRK